MTLLNLHNLSMEVDDEVSSSNVPTISEDLIQKATDIEDSLKENSGAFKDTMSDLKFEGDTPLPSLQTIDNAIEAIHKFVNLSSTLLVTVTPQFVEAATIVASVQNAAFDVISDATKVDGVLETKNQALEAANKKIENVLNAKWDDINNVTPSSDVLKLTFNVKKENIKKSPSDGGWDAQLAWINRAATCLTVFENSGKILSKLKEELEKIKNEAEKISKKTDTEHTPSLNKIKNVGKPIYETSRLILAFLKLFAFCESYLSKLILGVYKVLV